MTDEQLIRTNDLLMRVFPKAKDFLSAYYSYLTTAQVSIGLSESEAKEEIDNLLLTMAGTMGEIYSQKIKELKSDK